MTVKRLSVCHARWDGAVCPAPGPLEATAALLVELITRKRGFGWARRRARRWRERLLRHPPLGRSP